MKNKITTVNSVFVEDLEDAVVNTEKFFEEHDDPKAAQLEEAIKEAILTGEAKIKLKADGATRGGKWVIYYTPHKSGGILTLKAAGQTYAEKAVILNNLSWGIGEAAGELCDYLNGVV